MIEDCKELCDFYNNLVQRVGEFSFRVISDCAEPAKPESNVHPLESPREEFTRVAASRIISLFQSEMDKRSGETTKSGK